MRFLLARLRSLAHAPGFALAAILTLAVGIGASTAVFSVFSHVLLKPLPYPAGPNLVQVNSTREGDDISMSYLDLKDYRNGATSLRELSGYARINVTVTGDGVADRLRGLAVESSIFRTLGVAPALGRPFSAEEDAQGAAPTVLLSDGVWRTRYGSDPGVIGRTMLLNDVAHTIVGVMPPGFAFPDGIVLGYSDLWVPMGTYSDAGADRNAHPGIYAVGALAEGHTVEMARRDLESIAAGLRETYPDTNAREGVAVRSALEAVVGDAAGALWIGLGGSLLILLIACFNMANLLLARVTARHRELAIRNALGAGRRQLVGLVLGESMILAGGGGILGLGLGWALVRAAAPALEAIPRSDAVAVDLRVVAFAAVLALVSSAAAGVAPALRGAGAAAMARLRGRTPADSRASAWLVSAQVAVTLALLLVAGLLGESLRNLRSADPGVRPDGVLTFRVGLPGASYDSLRTALFYGELFDRIEALPGVRSAGAISTLPLSGSGAQAGILPIEALDDDAISTDVAVVARDYFETMEVRRVAGRLFEPGDEARSDVPIVVDERFAARFWPGEDPLGRQVQGWGFHVLTVVGVVEHVKNYGVAADSREEMYLPHSVRPWRNMEVVVRTDGEPLGLVPAVRAMVGELDPNVPLQRPRSMSEVVLATSRTDGVLAVVSRGFSVVATVLAALGLYGLLAYRVRGRRAEIALRMALGASARTAATGVIRQALVMAALGAAVGTALGVGAGHWLRSRLFGVSPLDAGTLAAAAATLLAVTLVAGAIPALRAAAVEPMEVLKEE